MGLVAVGGWLWATHPRRIVAYVCSVQIMWFLLSVLFPAFMTFNIADLLYWIPMSALFTVRTARDTATSVWIGAAGIGASMGFAVLGFDLAWSSAVACVVVTAISYWAFRRWTRLERSDGRVPPQSCWLRVENGLIPVEVVPGPDCDNCGYPHFYIGYSAFDRVEVDATKDPVVEVDPAEIPVIPVIFADVDGRRWLVPRP